MRWKAWCAVAVFVLVGCSRKESADVASERAAAEARVREAKASEAEARKVLAEAEVNVAEDRALLARAERAAVEAAAERSKTQREDARKLADAEKKAADAEARLVAVDDMWRKHCAEIEERAESQLREIKMAAALVAVERDEWEKKAIAADAARSRLEDPKARSKTAEPEKKVGAEELNGPTKEKAVEAAKAKILKQLKCPSTAKFTEVRWCRMSKDKKPVDAREYSYANWTADDKSKANVWSVILDVDSENTYGAMVRGRWAVLVLWVGGKFLAMDVSEPK